jgi:hypothetical protein
VSLKKNLNVNSHFLCKLIETEGSTSTFLVTHMNLDCGATVVFNNTNLIITCSCRNFESTSTRTFFQLIFLLYKYMTMHFHICRYTVQACLQSIQFQGCFHFTGEIYIEQMDKICEKRIL